ncbi:MAG: flagellar basal body P-ring protein FlgI [Betaproteobacteria bacterium]
MKLIQSLNVSLLGVVLAFSALLSPLAHADRIKDLASIASVRANQLIGYGLVIGLPGTGDGQDVPFAGESLRAMLHKLGVSVDGPISDYDLGITSVQKLDVKNVSAVMVTAELPPFAKPGQAIDVNVSAIGKTSSLRGGTLIMTRLRGGDGKVYAVAQGSLTIAAVEAGASGSSVSTGVATSGRIPSGALVEKGVDTTFEKSNVVILNINAEDFTTATAIVNAVNNRYGEGVAKALDAVSISLQAPQNLSQRVAFLSEIQNIDIIPGEAPARVVVNSRTGTVVISRNVRVTAAAVTHGSITVKISTTNIVSQPTSFAPTGATTQPVSNSDITVSEAKNPMFLFQPGVDLKEIVEAVNQVGVTPSALVSILEALKRSGSLRAELVVI